MTHQATRSNCSSPPAPEPWSDRTLKELEPMPPMPSLHTNVLLHSEETHGKMSVTDIVVPPHTAGPPLHTHDFDEAFYVLGGELIFQVDDALVTKRAGELSFA